MYTYIVELEFQMLHIKFQDHRAFQVHFLNLDSLLLRRLHIQFGFDWSSSFREKVLK